MKKKLAWQQQVLALEHPVEGEWCMSCALPSVSTRRFLAAMLAQVGQHVRISDCRVLTLWVCRDCGDQCWKEYRDDLAN